MPDKVTKSVLSLRSKKGRDRERDQRELEDPQQRDRRLGLGYRLRLFPTPPDGSCSKLLPAQMELGPIELAQQQLHRNVIHILPPVTLKTPLFRPSVSTL